MKNLLYLILLGSCLNLFADSPPLDQNHRYTGGNVTVLTLTKAQRNFLNKLSKKESIPVDEMTKEKLFSWLLKLTSEQTEKLRIDTGITSTRLEVRDTRDGDSGDCTCCSTNLSLRFSDSQIEVIHSDLRPDDKADAFWNDLARSFSKEPDVTTKAVKWKSLSTKRLLH